MADSSNSNTQPTSATIRQQIVQSAGLYLPSIYQKYLSFHDSLDLQTDSVGQQFIPVSSAMNNWDQKRKLFVVGLIPPSSQVSGRSVDRSNSIASLQRTPSDPVTVTGADQQNARGTGPNSGPAQGGFQGRSVSGVPGSNQGPPIVTTLSASQMAVAIRDAYVHRFGTQPSQNLVATFVTQSIRETSGSWPDYNPGYIGNIPPGDPRLNRMQTFGFVNPGGSVSYYKSYATPQDGAAGFISAIYGCGGQAAINAANNGDFQGYAEALHDGGYFTDTVEDYVGHAQNVQAVSGQIGNLSSLDSSILPPPLPQGPTGQLDDSTSGAWNSQGSGAANQSNLMLALSGNSNLNNGTETGRTFLNEQRAMAAATQQLLTQMANTPPLQFLVNPQSFKVDLENVISDGNWTRYGPGDVVEHWGPNQDKVEGSGKVAAFMAVDMVNNPSGPGLTRTARQYSASYQNFQSLYAIYRNNAGLFLTDNIEPTDSRKQNMSVLGSIYIFYDNTIYIGSFSNFTVTETDAAPFTLEYSFSFDVRASFTLDQISDPDLTFGVPQGGFTVSSPRSIQTSGNPGTGTSVSAESAGVEAALAAFNETGSIDAAANALNASTQASLTNNLLGR